MKNTTRKLLLAGLAGVSVLTATAVIAGGPGCGGYSPGYGYGPAMMGHGTGWGGGPRHAAFAPEEQAEWQLGGLRSALKLQPAQEGAWNAFANSALEQAKQMGQTRDEMWEKARTMPERMELTSKLVKEREQGMEKVTRKMQALYEVLTPEQRKVLDRRAPWVHG